MLFGVYEFVVLCAGIGLSLCGFRLKSCCEFCCLMAVVGSYVLDLVVICVVGLFVLAQACDNL